MTVTRNHIVDAATTPPITREDVLRRWFRTWANLPAWNRDLASTVELVISPDRCATFLGLCKGQKITIYRAVDAPRFHASMELSVLLHEMAHAATPTDPGHGVIWQVAFSRAVREVTGIGIPRAAENYRTLQRAAEVAFASWWRTSGNEMLLKISGVLA